MNEKAICEFKSMLLVEKIEKRNLLSPASGFEIKRWSYCDRRRSVRMTLTVHFSDNFRSRFMTYLPNVLWKPRFFTRIAYLLTNLSYRGLIWKAKCVKNFVVAKDGINAYFDSPKKGSRQSQGDNGRNVAKSKLSYGGFSLVPFL